jgi:molybdopterin molybdotransferase
VAAFVEHASLEQAHAWLDGLSFAIATATVEPARAVGRALLMELRAGRALPPQDCATQDGFALCAAHTEGAGPYNPVPIAAIPVAAGDTMPPGTDAVLPVDLLEAGHVLEVAAPGEGVARAGSELAHGALLFPAGHVLRPTDVAVLTELGLDAVTIRFGLTVGGSVPAALDALRQALMARDQCQFDADGDIIVTTRAEPGDRWDIQGVALRPGGLLCRCGWRGRTPLLLLPRDWLGFALCWELLAARLIRGHAALGAQPAAPHRLTAKLVSSIGLADAILVRTEAPGVAAPLPGVETGGATALARADGYVLVPPTREGYAAGETVMVQRFWV